MHVLFHPEWDIKFPMQEFQWGFLLVTERSSSCNLTSYLISISFIVTLTQLSPYRAHTVSRGTDNLIGSFLHNSIVNFLFPLTRNCMCSFRFQDNLIDQNKSVDDAIRIFTSYPKFGIGLLFKDFSVYK